MIAAVYKEDESTRLMHESQRRLMIKFLDEMPFAKHLRDFEHQDKLELVKRFELKHIKAGHRLFEDSD